MKINITEEKFKAFKGIAKSNTVNMFHIGSIKKAINEFYHYTISKDEIMFIIANYKKLNNKFEEERNKRIETLNHGKI